MSIAECLLLAGNKGIFNVRLADKAIGLEGFARYNVWVTKVMTSQATSKP